MLNEYNVGDDPMRCVVCYDHCNVCFEPDTCVVVLRMASKMATYTLSSGMIVRPSQAAKAPRVAPRMAFRDAKSGGEPARNPETRTYAPFQPIREAEVMVS